MHFESFSNRIDKKFLILWGKDMKEGLVCQGDFGDALFIRRLPRDSWDRRRRHDRERRYDKGQPRYIRGTVWPAPVCVLRIVRAVALI